MRRDTLFYLLMGILATGLVLLLFNHGAGSTFGLANEDFASLVGLTALAALFGAAVVRRREMGNMGRNALVWLVVILALVTLYRYSADLQAWLG